MSATGQPSRRRGDTAALLALATAAFALYLPFALRVAAGRYSDYYNLAFDFDPAKFVDLLAGPATWRGDAKHPLFGLLRAITWPITWLGIPPKASAGLLMAGCAALSVSLSCACLRALGAPMALAAALAAAFGVSATPLHLAMIPESYGPAMAGLLAVWLLPLRRMAGHPHRPRVEIALATASLGITLTNIMQPALIRLAATLAEPGPWRARMARLIGWGAVIALIASILGTALWADVLVAVLADPVLALKQLWWLRAAQSDKVGLPTLAATFAAYSFIAPAPAVIAIPGGIAMLDFRSPLYTPLGWAACLAWLALLIGGAAGWMLAPRWRSIAWLLLAAIALNLLLHLDFQFRGSVWLYAGHLHPALFLLGAGGLVHIARRTRRPRTALAAALALAALTATANLPAAWHFAIRFDEVNIPCPAPCADATGS